MGKVKNIEKTSNFQYEVLKKENKDIKEVSLKPLTVDDDLIGSYTTTCKLNLRKGAGKNFDVITVINKGDQVFCDGNFKNEWLYVLYGEYEGWCMKEFLK